MIWEQRKHGKFLGSAGSKIFSTLGSGLIMRKHTFILKSSLYTITATLFHFRCFTRAMHPSTICSVTGTSR